MKIETHAHTKTVSPCAAVSPEQMVKIYRQAGYDCIIITEHFNRGVLQSFPGNGRQKVERYLEGYYRLKEAGEKEGLQIWLGAESCIEGGPEDFLLFGIEEDFLFSHPEIYAMNQQDLYREMEEYGALLFQAHPNRGHCRPRDAAFLHGVEVYNGHPRHDNKNHITLEFAEKHPHLLRSSGSDYHWAVQTPTGGLEIPQKLSSVIEFREYLKHNPVQCLEE